MDAFTQKLRVIYTKLFYENIDDFTEALIDYSKFDRAKFDGTSESENKKQFFLNRKTVLRRWLQKGSNCTSDFQKSYKNYKISHYQLKGHSLFSLEDFKSSDNLAWFDQQIDNFLQNKKRVEVKTDYKYIYMFCEKMKEIYYYEIINWTKSDDSNTELTFKKENAIFKGTFKLSDENNMFLTLKENNNTLYMLFHDANDCSYAYIVGVSMGYLNNDNKVPRSQKLIFSKNLLNTDKLELEFILNETEVVTAIENRLNLSSEEVNVNQFIKYANKFKKFNNFFKRLRKSTYRQSFYYRLAFREFYAVKKLFKKVAKEESYYILDYQQAFLELLKTVEEIGNISLQVVMQLNNAEILKKSSLKNLEIKSKLFNLKTHYNVNVTVIFIVQESNTLNMHDQYLLNEMHQHNINVKTTEEKNIINEVDSLNFSFIHLKDTRDFVLADPIRDSKDVYKLFIDKLTMDEYRTDYQKILEKSISYSPQ